MKIIKNLKLLIEMFNIINGFKKHYVFGFILTVISSASNIIIPFIVLKIFDVAITNMNIYELVYYTAMIILVTIIGAVASMLFQYINSRMNRNFVMKLRMDCLKHINKLSGDYYTNYNSGDLYTILFSDIENIQTVLTNSFFSFLSNLVTAVGLLIFLVWLQADLLLILFSSQVILFIVQKKFNNEIQITSENTRDAMGTLNSSAQEMITNLFSFIENGLKGFFFKNYFKLEDNYAKNSIHTSFILAFNRAVLNFLNSLTVATILGYGGYKVIAGSLSLGGLVSFNLYSQRFIGPITQLAQYNTEIVTSMISWKRIKGLLDKPVSVKSGNEEIDIFGDIEFQNVKFSYDKENKVFDNLNLKLEKGKVHAIVGPSGVGKTTLIHLLLRLWDVNSGNIYLKGHDIKKINIKNLRDQISLVSQNIFLLNDNIYNNIVLDNKEISKEKLDEVLRQADIYDFINSLPDKLNTMIGENGIKVSGGEKQRISIARALLKNSSILIFDEATSMLDNETEEIIISQLLSVFKNKTIILIAHRLSTVKNADIIYVLREGKVIERGNHKELIEEEGFYYNLCNV
ncbi:ABC transporter ATP-binding protein [Clostridium beijerinckii]|uniref:ABC transporter ATP-binding protein n=1 Tax=Clostridium beijerinckii TaxID=1520 RepID=UPI00030E8D28|nr:ABC transporter ATP-binding protein [Clostridium beijerinckii]